MLYAHLVPDVRFVELRIIILNYLHPIVCKGAQDVSDLADYFLGRKPSTVGAETTVLDQPLVKKVFHPARDDLDTLTNELVELGHLFILSFLSPREHRIGEIPNILHRTQNIVRYSLVENLHHLHLVSLLLKLLEFRNVADQDQVGLLVIVQEGLGFD